MHAVNVCSYNYFTNRSIFISLLTKCEIMYFFPTSINLTDLGKFYMLVRIAFGYVIVGLNVMFFVNRYDIGFSLATGHLVTFYIKHLTLIFYIHTLCLVARLDK